MTKIEIENLQEGYIITVITPYYTYKYARRTLKEALQLIEQRFS